MAKVAKIAKKKLMSTKLKRSSVDLAIEDRLAACGRGEPEHIIYVGMIVENLLKGEAGAIIKALTAGRSSSEILSNMSGKLSSDRVLGRIEAYENLWNDLEQFVLDKDRANEPIQKQEEESSHLATQPFETQRHAQSFQFSA